MRKPTVEVSAKRRSRVRSGACAFFAVVSVAASQTLPAEVFQSGETVVSDVREYGSGTSLDFAEGATARVQTGGAIRYDGSGNTADAVAMSIGKGSKLVLDGGEVTFTNFTGGDRFAEEHQ